MQTRTTLSITQARKNIFSIAKKVQKGSTHYTLTEHGKPIAVITSAKYFEKINEPMADSFGNMFLADAAKNQKPWGKSKIQPGFISVEKGARVFVLREDFNKVVYSTDDAVDKINRKRDLIKSQLFVELIDKFNYPLECVSLGRYIKVGQLESKQYIEADILVNKQKKGYNLLFSVATFENFKKCLELKVKELFEMATSLENSGESIDYLIYFSRNYEKDLAREKIIRVDFNKFKSFKEWDKAGRPSGRSIPEAK